MMGGRIIFDDAGWLYCKYSESESKTEVLAVKFFYFNLHLLWSRDGQSSDGLKSRMIIRDMRLGSSLQWPIMLVSTAIRRPNSPCPFPSHSCPLASL
jgi:hypothetical protein